jgi:transposase
VSLPKQIDKEGEFGLLRFKPEALHALGVPITEYRLRHTEFERIIGEGGQLDVTDLIRGLMDWLDVTDERTQIINALRGHMAEHGWVAPKGPSHIARQTELLEDEAAVPAAARPVLAAMLEMLAELDRRIALLDREIARRAREDETARRLMTIPGIGPITATALAALAPPPESFAKGRDFAAWLGLVPRQHSSGGKQKLGAISRMGERTLRRLMIIGASAVVLHASKRGAPAGSWLAQMLARKPRMLVTVALANKTARIVWAVLTRNEVYRALALAAA